MTHRRFISLLMVLTACLLCAQQAPPQTTPTFSSEAKLVLVPFNVVRGAYFTPDVGKDDVVLLQDGKPRDFTIFEGPRSDRRMPVELILLFDTTMQAPRAPGTTVKASHWDPKKTYEFASHWGDKESRAVLEKAGAVVQVSVYRYDEDRLQRLSRPTRDPQALTQAIHLLTVPLSAAESVPLGVPKGRTTFAEMSKKRGGFDPKRLEKQPCWTLEAIIQTLSASTAEPGNAMRVMAVFSEKVGPTTTTPEDAAGAANALGIPVYAVVLDIDEYIRSPFWKGGNASGGGGAVPIERPSQAPPYDPGAPRGSAASIRDWYVKDTVPMVRFGSVGPLTGGEALYPHSINAEIMNGILDRIRDKSLSQYVVGFAPSSSGQAKKHSLAIKLKSRSVGKLSGGERTAVY